VNEPEGIDHGSTTNECWVISQLNQSEIKPYRELLFRLPATARGIGGVPWLTAAELIPLIVW